jgi:hypothetical protein
VRPRNLNLASCNIICSLLLPHQALGCILFALAYLTHPFQDAGSLGILNGKYTIPKNTSLPEEIGVLITRMLDVRTYSPLKFLDCYRPSTNFCLPVWNSLIQSADPLLQTSLWHSKSCRVRDRCLLMSCRPKLSSAERGGWRQLCSRRRSNRRTRSRLSMPSQFARPSRPKVLNVIDCCSWFWRG